MDAAGSSPGARIERVAYAAYAGTFVLVAAMAFYSSMRLQLLYSALSGDPRLSPEDWSAPLDDVFIHFDFARAAARGHPFEWVAGNGYSSGGTSLTYPLVLAIGYLAGFQGLELMRFAAVVACVSVLAFLIVVRRAFRELPRWTSYLLPPVLLSIGALDWTLWSGMEVAFFLALWAVAFVAWDDLVHGPPDSAAAGVTRRAAWLGLWSALVVATRPEAAVVVACFSLFAALRGDVRTRAVILLLSAGPPAAVVLGQSVINKILTDDWSAAGALVKLELYHPHLSARDVFSAWWFHVKYQVLRVSGYHVAGDPRLGALLWVLAAVPLFSHRTRSYAALLWASSLMWVAFVALNGQVRWQNERYTMPAVAWLLLSAAMGLAVLLTLRARTAFRVAGAAAAIGTAGLLAVVQAPRMRDQIWFFGRASRNVRDQHIKTARKLVDLRPSPRRIMVGDAGAIVYESDLPALDIIGLGGYRQFPFARASRWGVPAALELIQRMPPAERPDVLALYPSWWGDLPLWFASRIDEVPVTGNVICGGPAKVIYAADWRTLDDAGVPVSAGQDQRIIDSVDIADVLSERAHDYETVGAVGFVTMKVLPHPRRPSSPLWDAGRILPPGSAAQFRLSRARAHERARLLLRVAPAQPATLHVAVDGRGLSPVRLQAQDAWQEVSVEIGSVGHETSVRVEVKDHETALYHLWVLER